MLTCERCLEGNHRCLTAGCACSCRRTAKVSKVAPTKVARAALLARPRPRPVRLTGSALPRRCSRDGCSNKVTLSGRGRPRRFCSEDCWPSKRHRAEHLTTCLADDCSNLVHVPVTPGPIPRYCQPDCRPSSDRSLRDRRREVLVDGFTANERRSRSVRLARSGTIDRETAVAEIAADPSGRSWSTDARRLFAIECDRLEGLLAG